MQRHSGRERRGAVAVLVAICLVAIVGVVALVIDGGLLRDNRRRVQASADAAALAAAYDLYSHYPAYAGADPAGSARMTALATARANGYTNDSTNSVVTVNIPPTSGTFVGKPGYAEVVIEYRQKRGFSGMFGQGRLPVRARAVARGMWSASADGIIILNPDDPAVFKTNGNGAITVKNASVIVNSTAGGAATGVGNAAVSAPSFSFGGAPGYSLSGGGSISGAILTNQPPVPDPLSYLPPPNPTTLAVRSNSTLKLNGDDPETLQPGVYRGGISITGKGNVTLEPGIYYMEGGGFSAAGQGALTGDGVMIYNAPSKNSDVISFSGQGAVHLTPMTSGPYTGMTIFQDRTSANSISISGNGAMDISGTFYAARGTLDVTGNGAANLIGSQYVAYEAKFSGNGAVTIDWTASPTARRRFVGLVE